MNIRGLRSWTTLLRIDYFTGYVYFCLVLGSLYVVRGFWAWPDVTWQSQFWFIQDIDRLLSRDLANVTWFQVGGGQATNAYRWFEYFNATFFGLNSQLETLTYGLAMVFTAIAIGFSLRKSTSLSSSKYRWLIVFIPIILLSLPGSFTRGMELGTYLGLSILAVIATRFGEKGKKLQWIMGSFLSSFALYFLFLGGYAVGVTMALIVGLILFRKLGRADLFRFHVFTAAMLVASVMFSIALFASRENESGAAVAKLVSQQVANPFFIPLFISVGFAAALVNSQVLESLDGPSASILAVAISGLVATVALAVVGFARPRFSVKDLGAMTLILYGPANYIMLLAFRPNDQFQLLNYWYNLHSKFALVGVVWLAINHRESMTAFARRHVVKWRVLRGLALVMLLIFTISNFVQFERQKHEREYLVNVVKATLIPSGIEDNGELTALVLPYKETLEAIEILRKHSLGVFRKLDQSWRLVSGDRPYLLSGDVFADGWMGSTATLSGVAGGCRNLEVQITKILGLGISSISVTTGDGTAEYKVGKEALVVRFDLDNSNDQVNLRADSTFVPASTGQSKDLRELSFKLQIECLSQ